MSPVLEVSHPRPEITVLTLNRPDKLNALSYELVEALHDALDRIAAHHTCRVVVLTGAGRGFCSGLDLRAPNPDAAGAGTEFPRSGMRWQERIADLTAKIHRLRQPVIAAVNGVAYGGGLGIAAACDLRVASRRPGSAPSSSSSDSAGAISGSATRCPASSAPDRHST